MRRRRPADGGGSGQGRGEPAHRAEQRIERGRAGVGTQRPHQCGRALGEIERGEVGARGQCRGEHIARRQEQLRQACPSMSDEREHFAAIDSRLIEAIGAEAMGQRAAPADFNDRTGLALVAQSRFAEKRTVRPDLRRHRDFGDRRVAHRTAKACRPVPGNLEHIEIVIASVGPASD